MYALQSLADPGGAPRPPNGRGPMILYAQKANKMSKNILLKQTKIEIQNESKPIVATFVSKTVR